jgi:hypothetical protein
VPPSSLDDRHLTSWPDRRRPTHDDVLDGINSHPYIAPLQASTARCACAANRMHDKVERRNCRIGKDHYIDCLCDGSGGWRVVSSRRVRRS